jgi:hypothetical protein
MARSAKTSSPAFSGKRWTHRSGWFFLFLAGAALFYFHSISEKNRIHGEMTAKLHQLEKEKNEALTVHADLLLQIQSQSDPAWVEMVLKRNLGMVREGQVKVYFHAD